MINPQIAPHPVSWNRQNIVAAIKSASTITLFAVGVLGSMALAHFNYSAWFKTTLAVGFINLYAITKVLRYGSSRMIRAVLSINLTALGALSLGGCLTPALFYIPSIGIGLSFSGKVLVNMVNLLAFTAFAGYAAAPPLQILKKAYSILNDTHWARYCERLEHLYGHTPEAGFGLLQANLIPNAAHAAFPAWFFTITPGIESLNSVIDKFETFQARGQTPTPLENKELLYLELQFICDSFNFEEADKAGNILLEKSPLLLGCLTKEEYADLFQRTLLRKMNANIDDFLNGISGFHFQNRYATLMQRLNRIEADLNREPTDALKQQLQELIKGICKLKIKSIDLSNEINRWDLLFQTWGDERQDLLQRFSQVERLKRVIGDPNITNRLGLFDRPEHHALLERFYTLVNRFHLEVEQQAPMKTISQRINEAIYRLCSMGLILVPVCIFPKFTAAGFGIGAVYFILKRFLGFSSILEEACSHGFREIRMDIALDRKFFSLTEQARERMETFTQADLLKKIRLLNHEILGTFGMILWIAGLPQGVLLAKEVSELFPARPT